MTEQEKTEKKEKKERVPRQGMPEQDPRVRVTNFDEVPMGYSPETAMLEAKRCIQCKKPGCVSGCPVDVDIPAFIQLVADGDFLGAARKIKDTNCLPAVCGGALVPGGPVREALRPRQEMGPRCRGSPGALCCRLRAQRRDNRDPGPARIDRKTHCGRGSGTCRADHCRGSCQDGPRSDHL